MSTGHDHQISEIQHERPLWWALGLTGCFMVAEVIAGLWTNSLALLSDAAHMMTDVIALAVSLAAVRLSRKPADAKRSYGYARMESLGALVNGGLLFLVAAYILWEALGRFRQPPEVGSIGMLVIAVLGLIINLVSMRLLKAGSADSLNVRGAYLEVWSDMLGSLGVLIAALIIELTGWAMADPIVAALIGLWVLPRAWSLLRQAGHVLMQGVPQGMDLEELRGQLLSNPAVAEVHYLHAWALGSTRPVVTAHILLKEGSDDIDSLRQSLVRAMAERFDIHDVTLQIEHALCGVVQGQHPPERP